MKLNRILPLILLSVSLQMKAQSILPAVVSGKSERIENFKSNYVTARNVDVWLPEGYSDAQKFDVLYMHDGQMLFDPDQTWNHQSWNVDDVASGLMREMKVRNFIVVGIWNGGQTRHQDYFPQKPFEQLSPTEKDTVVAQLQRAGRAKNGYAPQSDNYLKFLVKELKPLIDAKYSVYTTKEHTFIAGSSMGGLISMYAVCEYPDVFGGAACMSTHWVGAFTLAHNPVPDALIRYMSKMLPDPKNHKIYFDCGNRTLDLLYPGIQIRVDSLMRRKGYDRTNWLTRYFPGEDHSERAWNKRLDIPLMFLLKR